MHGVRYLLCPDANVPNKLSFFQVADEVHHFVDELVDAKLE